MWLSNLSPIVLAFSVFNEGLAASYGIELLRTLYSASLTSSLVYAWHVCSILIDLGISEFIYPPNEMLKKLSTKLSSADTLPLYLPMKLGTKFL